MGDEQNKRISRRSQPQPPPQQENLLDSDFVLALALQEQLQERDFSMLPTVESDSDEEHDIVSDDNEEEEEEEEEDYDYNEEDYAFLQSQEIEAELRYTEGEDNDNNQELMEEDDIDPDELSYEELIALGEMVGEENRGLSAEQISECLSSYTHPYFDHTKTVIDRCVICQVEYGEGEKLVAIPCEHPYHSDCISKWLQVKKICPICGTDVSSSTANL